MANELIRFGVSLEKQLLDIFDGSIKAKKYESRSEAIRDLIRESIVKEEWQRNKTVTGAIAIVYDHHKRELMNYLVDTQHDYHECILSSQHLHLDHHNCFEIVAVSGKAQRIKELYDRLKSAKGVKHASFAEGTTGSELK